MCSKYFSQRYFHFQYFLIFNNKFLGSELKNPNFMKLADAYGAVGMKAENPDVLKKSLKEAIAMNKTVLIEVPIGQMPSPF